METLTDIYINKLYDDLQIEKTAVMLEYKNDKELKNTIIINQKLTIVEGIMKNLIKYRNIRIKQKLKDKDGYFVKKQEPEGGTLKTVFFGIDVDFFEKNFEKYSLIEWFIYGLTPV